MVFLLQCRHLTIIGHLAIEMGKCAVIALLVAVIQAIDVNILQDVHRLMVHARISTLESQLQVTLVKTYVVTHLPCQRDATAQVENGRVVDIGMVLLKQVVAQVILCVDRRSHFQSRLELGNAVFAHLHILVRTADGLIQLPVGSRQVNLFGADRVPRQQQQHEGPE